VTKGVLTLLKPFYPVAKIAESVMNYSKYGLAAIVLRKDVSELVSAVLELMAVVQRDSGETTTMRKTVISLYYYAAYKRLERGTEPRIEALQHKQGRVGVLAEEAPQDVVDELCKFLPFAHFAYAQTTDQADWQANNHGFDLVVSVPYSLPIKPAFSLLVRNDKKLAVLAIRGTNSITDVFTNGKQEEATLYNGVQWTWT